MTHLCKWAWQKVEKKRGKDENKPLQATYHSLALIFSPALLLLLLLLYPIYPSAGASSHTSVVLLMVSSCHFVCLGRFRFCFV